jgi:hypothetical protein
VTRESAESGPIRGAALPSCAVHPFPIQGRGPIMLKIKHIMKMVRRTDNLVISRYSYRRASTGSMREAFSAGHMPAVTPTNARITKAVSITLLDVFRTISPS